MAQRRLLIPSLAAVQQEAGFAIKTKANLIRVRTFQGGSLASVAEFRPSPIEKLWRSQWGSHLPASSDELNTVELEGEPSSEIEAELLFRNEQQQVSVLTGMVPLRDVGFKFSPILHQAHYNMVSSGFETCVVLANLANEGDRQTRPNRLQVEFRDLSAKVLAVTQVEAGLNSTFLLRIGELAQKEGISLDKGLSLRVRGGASQFAVFTVFHNLSSGALGIEHSLPPIYFTEAPFNLALRARFQKAAFGDLKL